MQIRTLIFSAVTRGIPKPNFAASWSYIRKHIQFDNKLYKYTSSTPYAVVRNNTTLAQIALDKLMGIMILTDLF